jgi:hypothetical protein
MKMTQRILLTLALFTALTARAQTPTPTELGYSIGVTSAIQTQLNAQAAGAAQTLTNKTFDASSPGNVLKWKRYLVLTHPDLADGTGAILETNLSGSVLYRHATFTHSTDQASNFVEYRRMVPTDLDTNVVMRAKLKFRLAAGDTGTHRFVLSTVTQADSAAAAGTPATPINVDVAADAAGASGDIESSAWTTLTGWEATVTVDGLWVIRLARDGDAATVDASTQNSAEMGLVIEYGVAQ